jgi:asparagine synthase (glutamine-hydrolysing)
MCGIAGIWRFNAQLPSANILESMSESIRHRGPDGSGLWRDDGAGVCLIHRRLSIIDLSDMASQPMSDLNQRLVIVFNGEIYNYLEIKKTLEAKGARFKTNSDTEVILAAYEFYGDECVSHFDGMFAFAIWDTKDQSLFLARDRFGEKPLFFHSDKQGFSFSSEIKALIPCLGNLKMDYEMIHGFLEGKQVMTNTNSFFLGLFQLAPATIMKVKASGLETKKYWSVDLSRKAPKAKQSEYVSEFKRLFQLSVERRLRSDVPVGCSLSGGLDSSSIVSWLNKTGVKEMHTFSARFKGVKDEGKWIAEVIRATGLPNHEIWPETETLLDELKLLCWHHEFPPASASVFAQWSVMKLPGKYNVKVLLDGQGADEYLAGYDELKYFAIWELYRKGNWSAFLKEWSLFNRNYGHHASLGYKFLFDPILSLAGKSRKEYVHGKNFKEVLLHYTGNGLGELLRYADRNSMAYSIEVRLPFLFHELVEFVFSLPTEMIYQEGKTKFVLRQAMQNILPEAISNRTDKIGFAPPQDDWMKNHSVLAESAKAEKHLMKHGLKPGPDNFRNLSTYAFMRAFGE